MSCQGTVSMRLIKENQIFLKKVLLFRQITVIIIKNKGKDDIFGSDT